MLLYLTPLVLVPEKTAINFNTARDLTMDYSIDSLCDKLHMEFRERQPYAVALASHTGRSWREQDVARIRDLIGAIRTLRNDRRRIMQLTHTVSELENELDSCLYSRTTYKDAILTAYMDRHEALVQVKSLEDCRLRAESAEAERDKALAEAEAHNVAATQYEKDIVALREERDEAVLRAEKAEQAHRAGYIKAICMERDAAHRAGYIQALRNVAVGAEYWRTTHERAGLFSAADRYHAMVHRAIHALADLGEEDAKRMVGGVE